jgi:hypothetical protein
MSFMATKARFPTLSRYVAVGRLHFARGVICLDGLSFMATEARRLMAHWSDDALEEGQEEVSSFGWAVGVHRLWRREVR